MQRIAILGSTGSIGVNTLDVVRRLKGRFRVAALSTRSNIELLAAQTADMKPQTISVMDERLEAKLRALVGPSVKVLSGMEGLLAIAGRKDIDMIVFALAGSSCLQPLLKAIDGRKRIALANKESLVSAGEIVTARARAKHVELLPIDSEHSAIYQCLLGSDRKLLKKIYLTSSGGPLLRVPSSRFRAVTRRDVLRHPRWKMGAKITVDSATLMNKGLEVIEARWLFNWPENSIDVLVHPEAIVHSLVELVDGSVLAQMAEADMRLPIQFAMTCPERFASPVKPLDLLAHPTLTFERPDTGRFPSLLLARQALRDGRTYPAVLNAADEEVVDSFLKGETPFYRIPVIIEKVLAKHNPVTARNLTLGQVFEADCWARTEAKKLCSRL